MFVFAGMQQLRCVSRQASSYFAPTRTFGTLLWHSCPVSCLAIHRFSDTNSLIMDHAHFLHTSINQKADNTKEPKATYSLWTKFSSKIQNFATGCKMLYQDTLIINKYRVELGSLAIQNLAPNPTKNGRTDVKYSRKELVFTYRFWKDLKKILPTVILFFIPFLGYAVPFIAFMYPKTFLSHQFLSPSLQAEVQVSVCNSQKRSFSALLHKLEGDISAEEKLSFLKMIEQRMNTSSKDGGIIDEKYSFSHARIPKDHWLARLIAQLTWKSLLCGGWGVRSLLPFRQQRLLQKHLEYIFTTDWLMHLEGGIETLPHSELISSCLERGLNFNPEVPEDESSAEMRSKLKSWMEVSTKYKECPSLLLAYLPTAQYRTIE